MNGIWITWERQRRNKGICDALGWPLFVVSFTGTRWQRYLHSILRTIQIIHAHKPKVIIAQNPSIVLATLIAVLKILFRYTMIIDAHNSGIYPMEGKNKALMWLAKLLQKRSDLTIVTNDHLRCVVEANGGRVVVLPDRLPAIPKITSYTTTGQIRIAYICTFSSDEPFKEVFLAANYLPKTIAIYVTGNFKGKVNEKEIPSNLHLMGFIPDHEFWPLLSSVDFIMDLTLRENCLVCGAYEAVSLEKPMILSETKALMEYFYKGCIYVSPESESIANGIIEAIKKKEELYLDILMLKEELRTSWERNFYVLKSKIEDIDQVSRRKDVL